MNLHTTKEMEFLTWRNFIISNKKMELLFVNCVGKCFQVLSVCCIEWKKIVPKFSAN
jgi:hypothetical protein